MHICKNTTIFVNIYVLIKKQMQKKKLLKQWHLMDKICSYNPSSTFLCQMALLWLLWGGGDINSPYSLSTRKDYILTEHLAQHAGTTFVYNYGLWGHLLVPGHLSNSLWNRFLITFYEDDMLIFFHNFLNSMWKLPRRRVYSIRNIYAVKSFSAN